MIKRFVRLLVFFLAGLRRPHSRRVSIPTRLCISYGDETVLSLTKLLNKQPTQSAKQQTKIIHTPKANPFSKITRTRALCQVSTVSSELFLAARTASAWIAHTRRSRSPTHASRVRRRKALLRAQKWITSKVPAQRRHTNTRHELVHAYAWMRIHVQIYISAQPVITLALAT